MTYLDGLMMAEQEGCVVKEYESPFKSFSVCVDDFYAIAINSNLLGKDERATAIFHELGHCMTGSFYNGLVACDIRQKHENRADRWAIEHLVPREQYDIALQNGCTELWNLAEYFGVTEDFMRKAVCWYTYGNLAVDQYLF